MLLPGILGKLNYYLDINAYDIVGHPEIVVEDLISRPSVLENSK